MTKAGQLITDGSAVWIVDDVRDAARVGDIIMRYIKANGATVKASEYPRLLAWVQESNMTVTAEQYTQDCSKYVYDVAQDKLTLPNMTGRVLQGGENVKSIDAGLPNITGVTTWHIANGYNGQSSGAFVATNAANSGMLGNSSGGGISEDFDASRSNPIYGRSDTVQPPALTMIAQIKY